MSTCATCADRNDCRYRRARASYNGTLPPCRFYKQGAAPVTGEALAQAWDEQMSFRQPTGKTHPFLNKTLNIRPLQHIQLDNMLHIPGATDSPYKLECSIYAQVLDTTDRAIVDAVINYAKAEGISDLYMLDADFVKAALLEKAERMKNAGRCCVYCGQRMED